MLESAANVFESDEKEQRGGAATVGAEEQAASAEGSSSESCPVWMCDWIKPCGRAIHSAPSHDPTPVCLMHSRDPEKSDAAFQEELEATLKAAGDKIADVTQFVFPVANYSGREFTAACAFHLVTFMGDALFGGARFARDADFTGATFTQAADFNGAAFTRDANFSNARFMRGTSFSRARFTQIAHFDGAEFTQGANFGLAGFAQDADFGFAKFTQDADFRLAEFTQDANFRLAWFTQDANFADATFTQDAKFGDARFTRRPAFKARSSSGRRSSARHTSGKHMVFDEEVDLEAAPSLWLWKDISDERDYGLIAALYQQLKKNYDERKHYWTAGDFHYGEMEMKRLASRTRTRCCGGGTAG